MSVPMRSASALLALLVVGCGGSKGESSGPPTGPTPSPDQVNGGQWSARAPLIEANSELALAESNGRIYLCCPPPRLRRYGGQPSRTYAERRLVRKKGFEPSRPCGHKLLRLARLPVPPLPHEEGSTIGLNHQV